MRSLSIFGAVELLCVGRADLLPYRGMVAIDPCAYLFKVVAELAGMST
jgi:hypothetical protein